MQRIRSLFRRGARPSVEGDRPWAVTACARLIALQALGLLALAWLRAGGALPNAWEQAWLPGLYTLLGLLMLLNTLGLLRLRPGAWSWAMTLQGASLLLALALYFQGQRALVLLQLLYGVLMVLYLNHPENRGSFPLEPFEAPAEEQEPV